MTVELDYSSWDAFSRSFSDMMSQCSDVELLVMGAVIGVVVFAVGALIMRRHAKKKYGNGGGKKGFKT